jgi:hypothetical protein
VIIFIGYAAVFSQASFEMGAGNPARGEVLGRVEANESVGSRRRKSRGK